LAGNLVNPLLSLYGTEWRERGYGLSTLKKKKTAAYFSSNLQRNISADIIINISRILSVTLPHSYEQNIARESSACTKEFIVSA
jgi:hypothetical protein